MWLLSKTMWQTVLVACRCGAARHMDLVISKITLSGGMYVAL